MALPKHYRFRLKNETGVPILADEITLLLTRKKHGPADAALNYESPAATLQNAASIANNTYGTIGLEEVNDGLKWEEGEGTFEATISTATPNGDIRLFFQISGNGTLWPDDDRSENQISVMTITTTTSEAKDFEF